MDLSIPKQICYAKKKIIFVHMMMPAPLKWFRLLMLKYEILMMM